MEMIAVYVNVSRNDVTEVPSYGTFGFKSDCL